MPKYRNQQYREENREKVLATQRRCWIRSYHGIEEDEYDRIMQFGEQFGCAICGDLEPNRFVLDHSHSSGKIRGVLCDHCNKGLGQFKDNQASLESALWYLEVHDG